MYMYKYLIKGAISVIKTENNVMQAIILRIKLKHN